MNRDKKDFFEQIAEQLQQHEAPYKEGAWEAFVQTRQDAQPKKTHRLKKWSIAASLILLMGLGTYLYLNTNTVNNKGNNNSTVQIAKNGALPQDSNTRKTNLNTQNVAPVSKSGSIAQQIINTALNKNDKAVVVNNAHTVAAEDTLSKPKENNASDIAKNDNQTKVEKQQKQLPKINVPYNKNKDKNRVDLPKDRLTFSDADLNQNAASKWSMGVVLTPAVGSSNKLNMGYGVTVGYKINDRFSVTSGVAYSELSGAKDVQNSSVVASSRTLTSVETDITGINFPINIRYHITDKLYASAGVSAMAVLSRSEQNHYVANQYSNSSFIAQNGNSLKTEGLVSEPTAVKKVEDVTTPFNQHNFAGFLNFSLGYKQKIFHKKSIAVEPFLSLPMSNNLSSQNIRLSEVGVRFRIGL